MLLQSLLLLLTAGFLASPLTLMAEETIVDTASARHCDGPSCPTCEEPACCDIERHDDVWVISSRCAPCCIDGQEAARPTLSFRRFDEAAGVWRKASADEFFAGEDAQLPTTFWVHGDRIEDDEVLDVGMSVYERLVECQAVERIRFVIWSWSASTVHPVRPYQDARVKGNNALADGYRLGWVLARMPQQTQVSFIGYSFAGRVILGAMHGMGGGLVRGHSPLMDGQQPGPPRYSVVIFVAAVDNHWLEPGQRFDMAPSQARQMLLLYNTCDRILKRYPKICGGCALGYTGIPNIGALGEHAERIDELDVCCILGPQHRWRNYVYSNTVMPMIREYGLPMAEVTTTGSTELEVDAADPAPAIGG